MIWLGYEDWSSLTTNLGKAKNYNNHENAIKF